MRKYKQTKKNDIDSTSFPVVFARCRFAIDVYLVLNQWRCTLSLFGRVYVGRKGRANGPTFLIGLALKGQPGDRSLVIPHLREKRKKTKSPAQD